MKIQCPRCGEKVEYMPGATKTCTYCKVSLQLPEVDQLPESLRMQWHKERAVAKAKDGKRRDAEIAEEERRKEKEKRAAEQEARLANELTQMHGERLRQQEESRKQSELQMEPNTRPPATETPSEVPGQVVADRYPGLQTLRNVFSAIMALCFSSAIILFAVGVVMFSGHMERDQAAFVVGLAVGLSLMAVWYWGAAEFIVLIIDLAHDVRSSRELLARLAYGDKSNTGPSGNSQR